MKMSLLRKFIVIIIITAPIVSYSGCKKQAKCGCGKDVIYTLTNTLAHVYFIEGTNIWFQTLSNPYAYYYFCNPTEMYNKSIKPNNYKSGDELVVSGLVYYDCSYQYQASNSYYGSYNQIYQVQVTDVHMDLYGK